MMMMTTTHWTEENNNTRRTDGVDLEGRQWTTDATEDNRRTIMPAYHCCGKGIDAEGKKKKF